MDAILGLAVERVRNRSERTFPGGFQVALTPQPSIVRINGGHFQTSTRLVRSEDVEGARDLMGLATDEVMALLGRRAWPSVTAVCEVSIDSAHTTLQRAARRRAGVVAFAAADVVLGTTKGAPVHA
jgi:hypothetical protein